MRDLDAYYILDGKTVLKVDREACYRWQTENAEAKIIAQEDVGRFLVSTVFLNYDHGFNDDGPPIVFETMVFPREADGTLDMTCEYQDRCATYEDAEQMHKRICDGVRAGAIPETDN